MTAPTHTFRHTVDAPLEEVFGWHTRPGAFARLSPPWLPGRITSEAASLRDGRALLTTGGHTVIKLVRRPPGAGGERQWQPGDPDPGLLTGIVQSPRGGTLRLLWPLAEVGAAGRVGTGQQWLSWIGIDDLTDVYYRALLDSRMTGPVYAAAPHPVRNSEYARVLGRVLRRPLQLPVPSVGPRTLLGREGASELAEASQRVSPSRLLAMGHPFRHPELEPALRHLLGRA